jgi:ABC-type molybdate transport system permease subunit
MTDFLKRTPVIWTLFFLMIVIGFGFGVFDTAVGGTYLDMSASSVQARETVAAMTGAQRNAHFWVTVLLDTAYPLAYGGFLAGMALRFFGSYGKAAAVPAFATIIVDLTENTVQALALTGAADVLDAKEWLTPLKFGLFFLAAAIALVALIIAIVNLFRRKQA